MAETILQQVGSRIRLYRKSKGMGLEELAGKICKSKASVSKYEQGQVALDIITLFDIAKALQIHPSRLFEDETPLVGEAAVNPFGKTNKLYLYQMNQKNVYVSILKIGASTQQGSLRATLFYKVNDPVKFESCDCIYHGEMFTHDMVLSLILQNYHNKVETALLSFFRPIRKSDVLFGMLSGLGFDSLFPTAHKIILSTKPLAVDDKFKQLLQISPGSFRAMKKENQFFVSTRLEE